MKYKEAKELIEKRLKDLDCFMDRILSDDEDGWVVVIQGKVDDL